MGCLGQQTILPITIQEYLNAQCHDCVIKKIYVSHNTTIQFMYHPAAKHNKTSSTITSYLISPEAHADLTYLYAVGGVWEVRGVSERHD